MLINVRMLTEGTDVPKVQSVFLTRQTTSSILLTQMISHTLKTQFNGTEVAYIVSFIDSWKHLINWADYRQFGAGMAEDEIPAYAKRLPCNSSPLI